MPLNDVRRAKNPIR